MNSLLDVDYTNTFITITDSNEGFADILEDFENEILDTIDLVDVSVEKSFPTRIVLNLVGYKEDILEACGLITQILLSYGVSSFNFTLHGIEECDGE